jgi:hypothetical protein
MKRKPNALKWLVSRLVSNIIYEFIRDNWDDWMQ